MGIYLPSRYSTYITGLWEMDRLRFRKALESLTSPSLIPTFPDEILAALVKCSKPEDRGLALGYYHTVQPPLLQEGVRDTFLEYLAGINITDAYQWAQAQDEAVHRRSLELVIKSALTAAQGDERAGRCVELVNLPLDEDEEEWFEAYLLEGQGRSLHGAKDTVMVRRIALGRMTDALEEGKHLSGREINRVTWDSVKDGIKGGLGHRAELYSVDHS
jgi:hypothetical protein